MVETTENRDRTHSGGCWTGYGARQAQSPEHKDAGSRAIEAARSDTKEAA